MVIRALDIPDTSKAILQDYLADYPVLTRNDFSDILAAHLLDTRTSLTDYTDITPDLANRILNRLNDFVTFDQFCDLLKTREVTYTRISRACSTFFLHIKGRYGTVPTP